LVFTPKKKYWVTVYPCIINLCATVWENFFEQPTRQYESSLIIKLEEKIKLGTLNQMLELKIIWQWFPNSFRAARTIQTRPTFDGFKYLALQNMSGTLTNFLSMSLILNTIKSGSSQQMFMENLVIVILN
jgi:hypothetical protein